MGRQQRVLFCNGSPKRLKRHVVVNLQIQKMNVRKVMNVTFVYLLYKALRLNQLLYLFWFYFIRKMFLSISPSFFLFIIIRSVTVPRYYMKKDTTDEENNSILIISSVTLSRRLTIIKIYNNYFSVRPSFSLPISSTE